MTDKKKLHLERLLSFLIPCCIMLLAFALSDKYPFGVDAALESDAGAQYYPFFLLLRRLVRGGESLLYTWRAGFGVNFWALLAYYCLNPWNLAALLLPETLVQGFLSLSVCCRIGLAGLFCCVLLQTLTPKRSGTAVYFSAVYGLSLWFVYNFFQLIWLDAAAMVPLVLAGTVRLVRERNSQMYTLVLFLSLICNPYMTYITAIMTVLCWIILLVTERKPLRVLPAEAGRFFGCSLLAGGMAAILLLPLAFALGATASAAQSTPALNVLPDSLPAVIGRLADLTDPIQHIGLPNLSSSMLCVFLVPGYLAARRIPLRERICGGVLLLFLIVSLWYPPFDYLWHGFHIPNGFIHRFAFLVPLVMLVMGYRFTVTLAEDDALPRIKKLLMLLPMSVGAAAVCLFAALYHTTDVILVSVILAVLYGLLYLWQALAPRFRPIMLILTGLLVCGELAISSYMTVTFLAPLYTADDLTPQPQIEAAAEAISSENSQGFSRTAVTKGHGFNPELFYDIPFGGTLYSSLISSTLSETLKKLGMDADYNTNYYFYQPLAPDAVLLTGIGYVIAPDGEMQSDALYRQLGDAPAYAFRYAVPAGFCVPADFSMPDEETCIPLHNSLFAQMTDGKRLYVPQTVEADAPEIVQREKAGESEEKENTVLRFRTKTDAAGQFVYDIYLDGAAEALRRIEVLADGEIQCREKYAQNQPYVNGMALRQLGGLPADCTVTVELTLRGKPEVNASVIFARLDEDALAAGIEALHPAMLDVTEIGGRIFAGSVTAGERQMLLLSVPYDKGWRITVDGEAVTAEQPLPGLIGIPLSAGKHTVRMQFTPQGFAAGCIISIGSGILYLLLCIRKQKKPQRPEV